MDNVTNFIAVAIFVVFGIIFLSWFLSTFRAKANNIATVINKRTILIIIGLVVFVMVVGYLFLMIWMKIDLGDLPPENFTSTTMYGLKRQILLYAEQNNRLPNTVDELPPIEGFDNRVTDVWGNKIIMQIDGTTVSLISYGKDKKPGGQGYDHDVIGIFEAKIPIEDRVKKDTVWIQSPLSYKKRQ